MAKEGDTTVPNEPPPPYPGHEPPTADPEKQTFIDPSATQSSPPPRVILAQPSGYGEPLHIDEGLDRPSSWLIPSFLACLCCFCPTGVCALAAAIAANQKADEGDMRMARASADTAMKLTIITVIIGVILYLPGLLVRFLYFHNWHW